MESEGIVEFEAGIFIIDKPAGISSFKVVSRMRRILGIKKVGHAGTLDPFATGLLVVCAGRPATRLISRIMEGEKEYLATLLLGVETSTQDTEGEVLRRHSLGTLSVNQVEECLARFRGEQKQVPPAYSALKHKGKPLYYYARRGIEIKKDARDVSICQLERLGPIAELSGDQAELNIRVVCSKGTYIRTLAADIGAALGCGAHLIQLRRSASGCFRVDQALGWDDLTADDARARCLTHMLTVEQVAKLLQ
jgi:tRNA pseudouridine55 synthase